MDQKKFIKLSFMLLLLMTSSWLVAQQNISGTVTDRDGEPLIGVNVLEKGTQNGTITNLEGNFAFTVAPGAVVVFSYTGFSSQEITIGDQTTYDIILEEGALLDEVVVVGYGTEQKVNLTGSVTSVDNEQLTRVPVANTANLLAGRVPGVMTRQNSGLPGAENTQIRIRGFANAPLILVDGVQMDFERIDPNDIESINVLKDASAAVYGARAGNGVVLVTTKRGKEGKPKITYNGSYSVQEATSFLSHVNPGDYVQAWREADLMDGNPIDITFTDEDLQNYQNGAPGYEGGDWVDALIENFAPLQQHNVSVSGGAKEVSYYTSFGYTDQESYFRARDNDYKRYNARSNVDAQINENLSFNLDLSYRKDIREYPMSNTDNVWNDLQTAQPIWPTSIPDPSVGVPFSGFSQRNPVARTRRDIAGTFDRDDDTFRGKLGLNYKVPFLKGLKARFEVNTVTLQRSTKTFVKPYDVYSYDPVSDIYTYQATQGGLGSIRDAQFRQTQIYPLVSLEYGVKKGDHDFKVLALGEQITRKFSNVTAARGDLLSTLIPEIFVGNTDLATNGGSSGADIGRKSVVGRLNYKYKGRYLFEMTMRADGNVLFSPEARWGYFPSFSAGWIASRESFLASSDFIDYLKIRMSYSRLGDDTANGLNGFDYLTGYGLSGSYLLDYETQQSIQTLGLVNPSLTWEEITMYNIGIEAEFLSGKLSFEADLFYRLREGLLAANIEDIPSTFGGDLPLVNLNSRDNRGIEFTASYRQRAGDLRFDISPNITYAKARWKEVKSQEAFTDPDQQRLEGLDGQWVNRRIGYLSDGIFMSQAEIDNYTVIQDGNENSTLRPGDIRYIDRDGDGEITFRDQDVIGYAGGLPELMLGLNFGVEYKNFRLSTLFQGASKFSINLSGSARSMFSNASTPLTYQYDLRWQPDPNNPGVNINPNAELPAPTLAPGSNNNRTSDFWAKDVNYFRLKNVNLAYTLPVNTVPGISNIEAYIAGENLFLLTNLGVYAKSFDPEVQPGQPNRRYPITRTYTAGLRVSF